MNDLQVTEITHHWRKTAEHDYDTMLGLFRIKRYSDALFYGHIVLEKMLKARVTVVTKEHAPYIHDLVRLADIASEEFSSQDRLFLKEMNQFNIATRYPDYKTDIYHLASKEFTESHLRTIKKIYKHLCQELKSEK